MNNVQSERKLYTRREEKPKHSGKYKIRSIYLILFKRCTSLSFCSPRLNPGRRTIKQKTIVIMQRCSAMLFNHSEFIIRRRGRKKRKKGSPSQRKVRTSKTAPRYPRREHPSSLRPSAGQPRRRHAGRPSSSQPQRRLWPRRRLASWPLPPHASLLPRPRPWRGARPPPAGGAR